MFFKDQQLMQGNTFFLNIFNHEPQTYGYIRQE
jgi:hypothetical protein